MAAEESRKRISRGERLPRPLMNAADFRFDADDCSVTVHLFLSAFDKANQQSHFDSQQVADL